MGNILIPPVALSVAAAGAPTQAPGLQAATLFTPLSPEELYDWRGRLEGAARTLREKSVVITHQTLASQLQVSKGTVQRRLAVLFRIGKWPGGIPKRLRGQRPPQTGQTFSNVEKKSKILDAAKKLRAQKISITQKNLADEMKTPQPRVSEWLHRLAEEGMYPDNVPRLRWARRTSISMQALSAEEIRFGFHWAASDLQAKGEPLTQKSLAIYLGMSESPVRRAFARLRREGLWVRYWDIEPWVASSGEKDAALAPAPALSPPVPSASVPSTEPVSAAVSAAAPSPILSDAARAEKAISGEAQRQRDTARLLQALQEYGTDRAKAAAAAGLTLTRARFLIWRAPADSPIAAYKDPADDAFFAQYEK